ncbi:hypothetical protein RYX45_14350 [Alkalihalophilus pseudofirmus]|uniref:Uncharacterized protein n=1 Tax=Alkalihalophilus pseudofirmus TaxID=79885 RepID=A0AAJ2U430_ALKPS|nr:hypothetical protein [Alkalihalophilus pseudofirmus]MDV2886367.1 hypothetical protein [Alkalihalophilus pseudofirmus]
MIDFASIPASKALEIIHNSVSNNGFDFTYTGSVDELDLFNEVNRKLIELEKSFEVKNTELESIRILAMEFRVSTEYKEEVLTRINWLQRLYKAKEEIGSIDTLEKVKQLRKLISPVQTCPMKQQLMTLITELEQSLPEADLIQSEFTSEQRLMEKAIVEAGDVFINLGKVGRESVIIEVISQYGEDARIDIVTEMAAVLEQRVKSLSEEENHTELLMKLEQLPLGSMAGLTKDRKASIVKILMKQRKWNGLAALDRDIARLNHSIAKEEQEKEEAEHTIQTNAGKASVTLNVNAEDNELIKYDK